MTETTLKKERNYSLHVSKSYKLKLDKVCRELSEEAEERITITRVICKLLDNYLEDAKEDIRKEL